MEANTFGAGSKNDGDIWCRKEIECKAPEAKRVIIERLYAAWLAKPKERLGQMIANALRDEVDGYVNPTNVFNTEDMDLVVACERVTAPSAAEELAMELRESGNYRPTRIPDR